MSGTDDNFIVETNLTSPAELFIYRHCQRLNYMPTALNHNRKMMNEQ